MQYEAKKTISTVKTSNRTGVYHFTETVIHYSTIVAHIGLRSPRINEVYGGNHEFSVYLVIGGAPVTTPKVEGYKILVF